MQNGLLISGFSFVTDRVLSQYLWFCGNSASLLHTWSPHGRVNLQKEEIAYGIHIGHWN